MNVRDLNSLLRDDAMRGKRVFVRADLNVPMRDGVISDTTRIEASLPTLKKLIAAGARVVLSSHLGRPKGKPSDALSLAPVAAVLRDLLGTPVSFASDCVGEPARAAVDALADGQLVLLENLRFHKGETDNDADFASQLASLADVYVNDAFGTAHRAHASTQGMVKAVPIAAAGDLMLSELVNLDRLFTPERPFLCLLGGAKVSDKLGVLEALIERADLIAVGGAMAYTFLAAAGEEVGKSLIEPDRFDDANRIRALAEKAGCQLLLPSDHVVADGPDDGDGAITTTAIPADKLGFDIGPESAARFAAVAATAKTILWNGPMGMFEVPAFAGGTAAVANAVANSAALSVVGGGDSLAAINQLGLGSKIGHLSTGGGASLEYVQGLPLPGVLALEQ
ncbi:MAG: phosphoglycerate kinase [Myxococcota bacterium]|jgi:phosphoglycerate kinase